MEKAWFTGLTWCGQHRVEYGTGTALEQEMLSTCGKALAKLINKTFTAQRESGFVFSIIHLIYLINVQLASLLALHSPWS